MNTGNSVRDADPRCAVNDDLSTAETETLQESVEALQESVEALHDSAGLAASGGEVLASEDPSVLARPSFQHVQDIQELIDKLAAVTKQLRHPGHS